ncbi:hypothetical protein CONCODRAFT_12190 [Conidiobolus coronatus NRRL 28638]|uniref:Uncharacterized protein n=1 Tax=Conidiobolus coronatus (strain ATCC 28846 / CBS 209.66 / NRRL 28638) TaxID=796925 RepID=A0A137NTJ6_CONC2|nr:hypothetical protein CONCODRAFT_12190 [Conidiobolus coronatus NRRL 28638]|eukprot:KXN66041.1 hypothetical protein CONCODRAFT_12190 [Conidiobolus coronatus NRRL 28638]
MKLLGLIIVASSVSCQHVTLFNNDKRVNTYKGYRCHRNLDEKATRVEVSRGSEVVLFDSRDCSRNRVYTAWGNYDFGETIRYRSVLLREKGGRRSSSSDDEVVVHTANDSEDSDSDDGGEKGGSTDNND